MSQASTPRSAAATESQQKAPATLPLVRVIAMPADANPNGDIFGGWLLAQMDLAGGSLATQRARGRCATVAVDGMVFSRAGIYRRRSELLWRAHPNRADLDDRSHRGLAAAPAFR